MNPQFTKVDDSTMYKDLPILNTTIMDRAFRRKQIDKMKQKIGIEV